MKTPRLGVNIDHVATLRQARGESYPSLVDAAHVALAQGADQITIHLREDRRHIQDTDVEAISLVTKKFGRPLNLEMAISPEIIDIALAAGPEWICLVPEKRQEKTTEGGLYLKDAVQLKALESAILRLRTRPNLKISLFLESDLESLALGLDLGVDAVELHTGAFAKRFLDNNDLVPFLKQFELAAHFLQKKGVGVHAGHGLTLESIVPLLETKLFEEYNIGHSIISDALFKGLDKSVSQFVQLMKQYPHA